MDSFKQIENDWQQHVKFSVVEEEWRESQLDISDLVLAGMMKKFQQPDTRFIGDVNR